MVDDPTAETLGGVPLSGHYHVDDEGVPAERVVLVERGKLRTFLLGRSPVLPFTKSNGHGRRERGYQAVARQGNLIVTSRKTIPDKDLRRALIDEVKRQNKPYGLWFSDIQGGYTITERSGPQAFKVMPLLVYRIWADGRPDELVRGVDIVGTPIAAFETIAATGDTPGIFNGMCGAESGDVPVSAVSPSLLLRNLEVERATHERGKPPLCRRRRSAARLTRRACPRRQPPQLPQDRECGRQWPEGHVLCASFAEVAVKPIVLALALAPAAAAAPTPAPAPTPTAPVTAEAAESEISAVEQEIARGIAGCACRTRRRPTTRSSTSCAPRCSASTAATAASSPTSSRTRRRPASTSASVRPSATRRGCSARTGRGRASTCRCCRRPS
ncbi:metallopeptidase TldD-related protein [Nannocystis pusilla]|uniref:metallopeptidase TldD-related protein n=1 Tax=Nannocystis pusilla TaxID=889268 RepID=UPI003B7B11EE